MPGVISVVAGVAAIEPPEATMIDWRSIAYCSAWRTFAFWSCGLFMLTARYSSGLAGEVTSRDFAAALFSICASCAGGTKSAPNEFWAEPLSAISVWASTVGSWLSLKMILLGPSERLGSVDCFQYLLRTITIWVWDADCTA